MLPPPRKADPSFFCFIDKPEGETSQRTLTRFKRERGLAKVGHHGTLDPFATGLLLVGVGEAAKFFRFLDDSRKTYLATVKFGERTDTLDKTGGKLGERSVPEWDEAVLRAALDALTGEIEQVPPMHSAVKVDGRRLYELARRGETAERAPRRVCVYELRLLQWRRPYLEISATVSRGTYIRVLAEQIAEKLGNVAHLTELRRTEVCGRDLARISWDEADHAGPRCSAGVAIPELLAHLPRFEADAAQALAFACGRPVPVVAPYGEGAFVAVFSSGTFQGVAVFNSGCLKAERWMSPEFRAAEFSRKSQKRNLKKKRKTSYEC